MKKLLLIPVLLIIFIVNATAQTNQNTGWLAFFHGDKFSEKWGMHTDFQLRSSDDFNYLNTLLIRPGVNYYINKNQTATAGYAFIGSFNRLDGAAKNSLTEHRIWQQYLINTPVKSTVISHRFRLEQRFIEQQTRNVFSQRLRYFIRGVLPLAKQKSAFTKGAFAALQNEVFVNIQNKEDINNAFFDQNRLYLAAGYRLSKKADIEAGYLYQYINGLRSNTNNNIIQLALYTRF